VSEQPPSDPTDPSGTPPPYGQVPPPYGQVPPPYVQVPPPYGQVPPGQYAYPLPVEPPATSKATTAMVLGITGLVVCPGVLSIPAWVIGHQAVREIDASQGRLGGRSQAQAGYILGIIGTVLAALGILAVVAIFVFSFAVADTVGDEFDEYCYDNETYSAPEYCYE
jgi:hypothetical protein